MKEIQLPQRTANSTRNFSVTMPRGFRAATTRSGLKKSGEDLAIIYSERPAVAAAVFTQNVVQAAPVLLSREHLKHKTHRAIIVNAGCANACTGAGGMKDAQRTTQLVAVLCQCDPREVLVASTGVIGVRLKMDKLEAGIHTAASQLSRAGGSHVAEAMMTTDTVPKRASKTFRLGHQRVTIAGVAKGAGMIHPNMATMLSFVTTDAAISKTALQAALRRAVELSFNRVTIDGDTSTNDTLAALANGAAENQLIAKASGDDFETFTKALTDVCRTLAMAIARDGEGARKLITIQVRHAANERDAKRIAETIANSPLVKTAIAGEDANWGRILAAAGRSGAKFNPARVDIKLGKLLVCRQGGGLNFDETKAAAILAGNEVTLTIDLNSGNAEATVWTCDFTEDYIKINADYRT